jgi:hypothetical protein
MSSKYLNDVLSDSHVVHQITTTFEHYRISYLQTKHIFYHSGEKSQKKLYKTINPSMAKLNKN